MVIMNKNDHVNEEDLSILVEIEDVRIFLHFVQSTTLNP
jgi:hypothetical protein